MGRRPLYDSAGFDPLKPLVVRRAIKSAGRDFRPGDDFPWTKMAISQKRARQLFDMGKLRHKTFADSPLDQNQPSPVGAGAPAGDAPGGSDPASSTPGAGSPDTLDSIDSMPELRAIAEAEGAPFKVSKQQQRDAIRAHRAEQES